MAGVELVGRWRLESFTTHFEDGSVRHPFGKRPQGTLVYTAAGGMIGVLVAENRPNLSTQDLVGGSEADQAKAFATCVAYCGTYEVDDGAVIHNVEASLLPDWVGTRQKRHMDVRGDDLVLRTDPMQYGGRTVVSELHWIREE
jgi:hypothetical protein